MICNTFVHIYYISSDLSTLQILISAFRGSQNERLMACTQSLFLEKSISISELERLLLLSSASLGVQISLISRAPSLIQAIHRGCSV